MKVIHSALFLFFLAIPSILSLSCKLPQGSVAYYTGINLPKTSRINGSFLLFTNESEDFTLFSENLDANNSVLHLTLDQANEKNIELMVWNDDIPNDDSTTARAHAKGVIVINTTSNDGFYFGHSMPNYPAMDGGNLNFNIPESADIYGQNFFCLSLDQIEIEKLAQTLLISRPNIYYNSIQSTSFPNLIKLGLFPRLIYIFKFSQANLNLKGAKDIVAVLSKSNKDIQMYEDVLVPFFGCNMMAETWGRPIQSSNCTLKGGFTVKNIQTLKFNEKISWGFAKDHSKWGLCDEKKKVVCLGDINRMNSQMKRGGSYFCFYNEKMWKAYYKMIAIISGC